MLLMGRVSDAGAMDDIGVAIYVAIGGLHDGHIVKIDTEKHGCGAYGEHIQCSCGAKWKSAMNGCWQCDHQREETGDLSLKEMTTLAYDVEIETLPHKFNNCTRNQFVKMGIIFGEEADDLFSYVALPKGWKKQPTSHSMWYKLLDEQGRERASIFYKSAFYDRDAFLNIIKRFGCSYHPVLGYENPEYQKGAWVGVATDCNTIIWQTEEIEPEPKYEADRDIWIAWIDKRDELVKKARLWLVENYPEWENPLAYW